MRKCRFVSNNPQRGIPGDNAPETEFFFHGFNPNKETGAEAIIEDPTGRVFEVRATQINFITPPAMEAQALGTLTHGNGRREREAWKQRNFGEHYANDLGRGSFESQLLEAIFRAELSTPDGDKQLVIITTDVGELERTMRGKFFKFVKVVYRAELEANRPSGFAAKEAERMGILGNRTAAMSKLFEAMFQGKDVEPFFGSPEWLDKYKPREAPVVLGMDFDKMEEKVLLEEAGRRFIEQVLPWVEKKCEETESKVLEVHLSSPGHLVFYCKADGDKLPLVWKVPSEEQPATDRALQDFVIGDLDRMKPEVAKAYVDSLAHAAPEATNGDFKEETAHRGHVPGRIGKPLDWDSLPKGDGEQK